MLNNLVIVNTLGYKDKGVIISIEENGQKKLVSTSPIVGFIIQNIGNEPIQCLSEEFRINGQGRFIGEEKPVAIMPRQSIAISRKYLALLALQPEVNMEFGNGKMASGSSSIRYASRDDALEAFHFSFYDKNIRVHSPGIKLPIARKVLKGKNGIMETKWIVKHDFEAVFGYLNNEEE